LPSWNLRKVIENALAKKESATILPVPIIGAVRKSLEVTMTSFVKILVAVCAVLMSVTSWAETAEEMELAEGRYGLKMQSMTAEEMELAEGRYGLEMQSMVAEEMEFAKGRYGLEMQSMMNVCMDMQRNGDLPGIRGGEGTAMEFHSESVDFSKRDDVVYPLQMQCMVIKDNEMLAFIFNKETADADWTLVQ